MDPLGLGLSLAGLAALGGAWYAYGRRRAIADTPTSKVRSMALGPVELQGQAWAAPGLDLQRAPFTDEPCVYWRYQVEERRTRHTKNGTQHYWATVDSGRSQAPFGLRDDTGVVGVDPEGGDVPAPDVAEFGSGLGRDPPPRIQAFLSRRSIDHESFFGMNKKMRFTEHRLAEGTPLYVLGNATRPEDATGAGNTALVVRRKGDGAFLVSTANEKQLLSRWTWGVWVLLVVGIGLASVGASRLVGA